MNIDMNKLKLSNELNNRYKCNKWLVKACAKEICEDIIECYTFELDNPPRCLTRFAEHVLKQQIIMNCLWDSYFKRTTKVTTEDTSTDYEYKSNPIKYVDWMWTPVSYDILSKCDHLETKHQDWSCWFWTYWC